VEGLVWVCGGSRERVEILGVGTSWDCVTSGVVSTPVVDLSGW